MIDNVKVQQADYFGINEITILYNNGRMGFNESVSDS
jgi:hypothetical protein